MARLSPVLAALLLSLSLAVPASAQFFEDEEEEDETHPVVAWALDTGNRASVGVNGVLTSPADPVMFALEGQETFESLAYSTYTGPVIGFFAGGFQMPYRILMGTFDTVFCWVPKLYMQSPVPRFTLFPWMEHDEG